MLFPKEPCSSLKPRPLKKIIVILNNIKLNYKENFGTHKHIAMFVQLE
jgi:hypothetical protein